LYEEKPILENIKHLLGNKIKHLRTALGKSQEELGFSCGLHRTYISDIERGTRNISIENIAKIAESLKVKPKELLDFRVRRSPSLIKKRKRIES